MSEVATSGEGLLFDKSEIGAIRLKKFKEHGWLKNIDPNHSARHMYEGTYHQLTAQLESSGVFYNTGLTPEEERFLEKKMHLPVDTLSRYNKAYWAKQVIIKIPYNGTVLLPDTRPMDYIIYKACKEHTLVANSEVEKTESPFAQYVLSSQAQVDKQVAKDGKVRRDAYAMMVKMSTTDMIKYLRSTGKKIGDNESVDFIEKEIYKIIENTPDKFLSTINSPRYKDRAFIMEAVMKGAIFNKNKKYEIPNVDQTFYSMDEVADFLNDPLNQEIKAGVLNNIDLAK